MSLQRNVVVQSESYKRFQSTPLDSFLKRRDFRHANWSDGYCCIDSNRVPVLVYVEPYAQLRNLHELGGKFAAQDHTSVRQRLQASCLSNELLWPSWKCAIYRGALSAGCLM